LLDIPLGETVSRRRSASLAELHKICHSGTVAAELALATAHEGGHAPLAEYLAAQLPEARALVERLGKP